MFENIRNKNRENETKEERQEEERLISLEKCVPQIFRGEGALFNDWLESGFVWSRLESKKEGQSSRNTLSASAVALGRR